MFHERGTGVFAIREAEQLNAEMTKLVIDAPDVAAKAQPGQFVVLRACEGGERIPLTICEADTSAGTVTVIFQAVGASTMRLARLRSGEALPTLAGPLGNPTDFGSARRVCVIGGGLGTAIAYPEARHLHELGRHVDVIVGFRTAGLVVLQEELAACSEHLTVMTDDGSNGHQGFVTVALQRAIDAGAGYDLVIAIGPPVMMKNVCAITKETGIRTLVSLNPIMIDGTGMCGGCRVNIGGRYLHACVDGPDFDGHLVDWDELMHRSTMYSQYEAQARAFLLRGEEAVR